MFSGFSARGFKRRVPRGAVGVALSLAIVGLSGAGGEEVSKSSKQIIGATATITEIGSGLRFPARIDTGARSCSLHVEKIEIEDESAVRVRNVGKKVRFLVKYDGESKWIEATIAKAVRIKSPALKSGDFDRRYKVPLTLQWRDFSKEVLVTLNDRTHMEYPLLVGRNFLRGDFLVDVEKKED
jgi:hypothetical protein